MQHIPVRHASWQELLGSPTRSAHIVQVYESDDFLAAAVTLFAAEGLRQGEAVLLTGTPEHLAEVQRGLASRGADPRAAIASGQLCLYDVHEAIAQIITDGKPDAERFDAGVGTALSRATADGRFSGVRWWGEITNTLVAQGNAEAGLACEHLGNAAIEKHGVTIFCSWLDDKFDPAAYDGLLPQICACHSHVIPARDYVRHRLAVNRAVAEVVGEIRGPLLQSLLSWRDMRCDLPTSQALLFWLHDAVPDKFHSVLERARVYEAAEAS